MLHGDKSYLKASLTRGLLELQNRLIELYTGNLQAIGTQAALIGAFAFAGIGEIEMPKSGYTWIGLSYLYDFFIHMTLCLSIFAVSQSTVVTIFGPSVALKGADTDVVLYIAQVIRDQRKHVLFIGAGTVTSIFCATIANFWAKIPPGVAGSATIVFFVGYCFIVSEGLRCYNAFHPDSVNIKTKNIFFKDEYQSVSANDDGEPMVMKKPTPTKRGSGSRSDVELPSTTTPQEESPKLSGPIFWRLGFSEGAKLTKVHADLRKGILRLFKQEEDMHEKGKVNGTILLKDYKLTTNYSKFPKTETGVIKSVRGAVFGQDEFNVIDLRSSEYDLHAAVKKYRFVLLPRKVSEINPLDDVELMCGDQKEYEKWTKAISKAIKIQSKIVGTSATDGTLSTNDVESMIVSANIAQI